MLGASGMKRILVTGVGGSAAINFVRAVRAANEKVYSWHGLKRVLHKLS